MSEHAGKYRTEDKLEIQTIHKLNTPQKKANTKYSKSKLPGLVASYDIRLGNKMGLFYNATKPTLGHTIIMEINY